MFGQPTSQFFIRGGLGAVQPGAKGHTEIQPNQLAKLSVGISPSTDRPNVELCFAAGILIPHVRHYYGGYYYCCCYSRRTNTCEILFYEWVVENSITFDV